MSRQLPALENFMSWLPDWLTGYDAANAARAAAADNELRAMNQAKIDSGYYSPAQAALINQDYATQESFDPATQRQEIDTAFVQGLADSRDQVKGFFNGAVWQLLKSVPLVVWIGLAVAVFVWMGGLSLLKGKFAK